MFLKTLHLRQFRNYLDQHVYLKAPKTILVGDNAQGKSNLLEAVGLLSSLRSHRTSRDRDLIWEGASIGQITALLERDSGPVELALTLRQSGRRTVGLNGETLRRHLDFLGVLNTVQFSSLDLDLVRGGPEHRRHWMDALLIQLEPVYSHLLQQYNQVLKQRNALLKEKQKSALRGQSGETHSSDSTLISPISELALWDAQLAASGSRLIRRRARMIERLAPLAQTWHQAISNRIEQLEVQYAPNVQVCAGDAPDWLKSGADPGSDRSDSPEAVQQAFLDKIQARALAEHHQGTSLVGPHRDEVELIINGTPARHYGSQGQQRTLVLALKLAELKLIEEVIGEAPLLLLDDVLAELDLHRQNQLLEAIQERFQTLITTTHLGAFDAQWLKSAQILTVQAGLIAPH
ncbi:DNA replication/repair protein RecF [Leptolyngbya sp. 'hensonii']|uniref:DNA replication/repair protein RecF n=1 Tax=Leptolyngbya sp. 'hensonii' TaxID=1922337 RepID=UPI00094FB15C|nr:DNA replication/repair protein RecF [Leptolyngbya sp. 'hensonii']OLP20119.1 DNA replication/repair protein RecF [Leptolyngbya sp. 'hensonii']